MSEFHIACLGDPRLGEHATSARPAWLWSPDASNVLWANPTGAAIFGAASPAALATRQFDTGQPAAARIADLAPTLPVGAPPRLERLRGFGAGVGRTLAVLCSRIALPDGRSAILVVATEPAGPQFALGERAARLLAGTEQPVAAFTPNGHLLHATRAALVPLGGVTSLSMLGVDAIADAALREGHASSIVDGHLVTLDRIGHDDTAVLIATLRPAPVEAAEPTPAIPAPPPEAPAVPPEIAPEAPQESPQETPREPPQERPQETPQEPPQQAPAPPPETPAAEPPEAPPVAPQETPQEQPQEAPVVPPPAAPEQPPTASAPPADAIAPEAAPAPQPASDAPGERRHPLRFVWQMDADGRFTVGNGEFTSVVGARTAALLGRPWNEIATELGLDPHGAMAQAIASRDTWSGIEVPWPVESSDAPLTIELSGLPVFDRERRFGGYRGFGVCRDLVRLAALARPQPHEPIDPSAPTDTPPPAAGRYEPPALQIVSPSENVVMFRPAPVAAEPKTPTLSPVERNAFRELARKLTARLREADEEQGSGPEPELPAAPPPERDAQEPEAPEPEAPESEVPSPVSTVADLFSPPIAPHAEPVEIPTPATERSPEKASPDERPILDRMPIGVLVHRLDSLLYANRAFLDWTGYADLRGLEEAGGLDRLFIDNGVNTLGEGAGRTLTITTHRGDTLPVEGRLFSIPWDGESAQVLMLVSAVADRTAATETALRLAASETRELRAILDTAADGIVVIDRDGRILSANRSAEILFDGDARPLSGKDFRDVLAAENRLAVTEYFEALARQGAGWSDARPSGDGREVTGRGRHDKFVPLFMTLGRLAGDPPKFCAVFRDITSWKRSEEELTASRRQAEKASSAKSEFLAKVSHEIRTPLNAIIGFSEVMMEERFGPIGNERYREYLKDIHASGGHVVALLNDLLDLSKIEAGKLDLNFGSVDLNDLTQQCVALMQPQANRERIIIRSSLSPSLPPIVADARSVKQIVLNLVSNSIKFTGAGGQVIVSTAYADSGEAVLRVRDTGVGMSEQDIATALEPFRQLATSARWGSGGTGLGLPLTKALAEANRAGFTISSAPNAGTLVEIVFPAAPMVAE